MNMRNQADKPNLCSPRRLWTGIRPSIAAALTLLVLAGTVRADLNEVKQRGVLRHVGVIYGKFVTGSGDGLDTELVKLFAHHLGVGYEFVQSTWEDAIGDITGKKIRPSCGEIELLGKTPIRGDLVASGFTVLPWREKILNFSLPTFPTGIWLIARADSTLQPIKPSGEILKDIAAVKALMKGRSILGITETCLDPVLYSLKEAGAKIVMCQSNPNKIVPALLNNEAEASLIEAPEALSALQKWPGQLKTIGPVSCLQVMASGFPKNSPQLRKAFNEFLTQCKHDGTYHKLIRKYFPAIISHYPDFFEK